MKCLLFAIATTATLGLSSCLNSTAGNSCDATIVAPALTVSGPKTVGVNQPAAFALTYQLQSGCGKLGGATATTSGNTQIIGINTIYSGCTCPQTAATSQTTYTFQPTQAGTYYLKFIASTTTGYITDTLVAK